MLENRKANLWWSYAWIIDEIDFWLLIKLTFGLLDEIDFWLLIFLSRFFT